MMTVSRRGFWTMTALAPLLASCASPNPTLYMLSTIPGSSVPGAPRTVVVRQIGLARYLERSQIVRSSEGNRLDVLSGDWWGEPLGAMMSRVVVEDLAQRMPGANVFGENGAISADADATIEINIQRMDADQAGAVVLVAQFAVLLSDSTVASMQRSERYRVVPASNDTGGLVSAMSIALGQLSDGIAALCHEAMQASGQQAAGRGPGAKR
jgi:uncharacterized protein